MNTTKIGMVGRTAVFISALFVSATCSAWHGGYGGGYGGGYYHGGGGYYHGGYYNNGGYYHNGGAVVIGVPGGGYGYYGPSYAPICQTVRYCYDNGQCVMQQECD